jgi:tetratricopeptide (TPR) repeat protein
MLRSTRSVALALALGGGALLAACDAGSSADDAATLLTDARIARQAGDLDEAVRLLEEALALDPASAPVRTELASAYLEGEGVDVLDVDRLGLYLTEEAGGAGATAAVPGPGARVGAACAYGDDPTAEPFDPRGMEGYPEIEAARGVLQEALALLHEPPSGERPVMPASLRTLELCSAVVDGALNYDREAALADLRAAGLSDTEIATALAVNASARFFDAYFFVVEDIPQQTAWYRLADGRIGVCAEDEEALRAQSEEALADLFEALVSLDLRAQLLGGSSTSAEIVARAVEAYEELRAFLGPVCGG